MSIKRWNARRDANEKPIVRALQKAGAKVIRLDAFDLLVLYRGKLFMLDPKTAKGEATDAQEDLIDDGWPLVFVEDEIEALRAIGAVQ